MEILFDTASHRVSERLFKKMDKDERIVRESLVKTWTKILERYARPGMHLPSIEVLRRELIDVGVDAAVDAVVSAHWWVFSGMVRDEIHRKVDRELANSTLAEFLEEVRIAQQDPGMLVYLREKIRNYVMGEW